MQTSRKQNIANVELSKRFIFQKGRLAKVKFRVKLQKNVKKEDTVSFGTTAWILINWNNQ